MSDPGSFDDELRRMARRSTEETASATNVDAELDVVHDRIAGRVALVTEPRGPDKRLMWLSAAAVTMLLAGVVALVATRDDGDTITAPAETEMASGVTTIVTSTAASTTIATSTTLPAVVETTAVLPSTSNPPTTIADESAPPPATTAPVVETTTPTSTTSTTTVAPQAVDCPQPPTPPPSLADGSPVGEPTVTDADKGLGTVTYTWGTGVAAVSQGAPPGIVQSWDDPGDYLSGVWTSMVIQELPDGPYSVLLFDLATGCDRFYTWSEVTDRTEVEAVALDWVRALGADSVLPEDRRPALTPDVPYVAQRVGLSLDGDEEPLVTYLRIDDGGTRLTGLTDDEIGLDADYPIDLGAGRRIGLVSGRQWEPCPGEQPTALGDGESIAVDSRILADPVSSIAGHPSGWVVVTRGVCPDGMSWGQPGTAIELVRHHVDDPDVEPLVVGRIDPEPNGLEFLRGRWQVRTVDGSGRFAGVWEATSVETGTFHVVDMLAPDGSTTTPLELPSGCEAAGDIVAPPRFADGAVVIARACVDATLVVDVISLTDRTLTWSQTVEGEAPRSDDGSIAGLSAIADDGEIWVLATFEVVAASDEPFSRTSEVTRSVLLNRAAQTELPAIGGVTGYAFTLEDLATNR